MVSFFPQRRKKITRTGFLSSRQVLAFHGLHSFNKKRAAVSAKVYVGCFLVLNLCLLTYTAVLWFDFFERGVSAKKIVESIEAELWNDQRQLELKNKPSLIIHIGPSKTASSTLQNESTTFQVPLAADKFIYLGQFADRKVRLPSHAADLLNNDDCLQKASSAWQLSNGEHPNSNNATFADTECWKTKTQRLQEYYNKNISVILSDEKWSFLNQYRGKNDQSYYKMLRVAFQEWNVVVVPTYRRYTEWIVSVSKQYNSATCLAPDALWPEDGGKACLSVWKRISVFVRQKDYTAMYINLDKSIPFWRNAGFPVSILQSHNRKHITCSFYCDVIQSTHHTCDYCLQKLQPSRLNALSLDMAAYNDLVFAASEKGMIDTKSQSRQRATENFAYYFEQVLGRQGMKDLPLLCPSVGELGVVLAKSLAFEKLILPEFYNSPQGEARHRLEFWSLVDSKVFCWVDTDKIFEGKFAWEQVKFSLRPP